MMKMVRVDYYQCTEYDIIILLLEVGSLKVETLYGIMKVVIERNYLSAYERLMNMYKESNVYHRSTLGLFGTRTNYDICSTFDIVMRLNNNYCLRRICKLGRTEMFNNLPKVYLSIRMVFHCIKLTSSYCWYIATYRFMQCVLTLLQTNGDYKEEILSCYADISQLLTRRKQYQNINIIRLYMKSMNIEDDNDDGYGNEGVDDDYENEDDDDDGDYY